MDIQKIYIFTFIYTMYSSNCYYSFINYCNIYLINIMLYVIIINIIGSKLKDFNKKHMIISLQIKWHCIIYFHKNVCDRLKRNNLYRCCIKLKLVITNNHRFGSGLFQIIANNPANNNCLKDLINGFHWIFRVSYIYYA